MVIIWGKDGFEDEYIDIKIKMKDGDENEGKISPFCVFVGTDWSYGLSVGSGGVLGTATEECRICILRFYAIVRGGQT